MALLVLGFVMVIVGACGIRYVDMANNLAQQDEATWRRLGNPGGFGFFDQGKTLALHNWIMVRGYEKSASRLIREMGAQARIRAQMAQYSVLCGAAMIGLGFFAAIFSAAA